jgi:hypothetical protein
MLRRVVKSRAAAPGAAVRIAWAIVLLVGFAGCVLTSIDVEAECLKDHPGQVGCCYPGGHVSNGTCCPPGYDAISDVEHEAWRICTHDEAPCADAGVCLDAGADAEAGADGS